MKSLAIIFGKTIRKIRISRDMSQEDLALSADLERGYISMLERGTSQPTLSTIFSIADALSITPVSLIKEVQDEYTQK